MSRRNQNHNRGSASCSTVSRTFKGMNKSPTRLSRRLEISKYFETTAPISESSETNKVGDVGTPYKNIVSKISSNLNDSLGDDDFRSPKYFNFRAKVQKESKVNKSRYKKYGKQKKRNISHGQKRLTNMLQENFARSDVHPEHLQMALALSKSEQPIDVDEENIENAACSSSQQMRILGVRRTLEQFGFKSNRAISRNIQLNKKPPRKSKYEFITPILHIRTEEDRQNLISSKISMILSSNSQRECNYEGSRTKLTSSYLSGIVDKDCTIFNLNKICINEIESNHFYCKELEIERNTAKCGHALKDWSKIPGRDITPLREITTPREINCVDVDSKDDHPDKADDIICISSESETEGRAISPDLFTSDDENMMGVRDNIDKTLKLSLDMISNLKNSSFSQINNTDDYRIGSDELNNLNADDTVKFSEESPGITQNDRLDNTDDILGTLEISLSKDVESIQYKNNQIVACSASLLSNLGEINRDEYIEMDKDISECSDANFTYQNISGIEHFENFSDNELNLFKNIEENQDNHEIKSDSSKIDLTLSDDEIDNSDKIIDNATNTKSCTDNQILKNEDKFNKYEILSDSTDYECYDDKNEHNSSEIKNLFKKTILNNTNLDSDANKIDSTTLKKSIRKSQSFTSNISTKTPENFKKYASFTSPKQHQAAWDTIDEMFKRYPSSNSISSENDVVHISDEELNYSALHSKENDNLTPNKNEENLNSYSYLEKYNDEFYFAENPPQTPIVHRRILQLNKSDAAPIQTPNSSQNNQNLNPENNTAGTPDGYVVIKTKDVTPLPDYDAMSSPKIGEELEKIGVKRLKRHRAVQILKYIYETTHPICSKQRVDRVSSGSDADENKKVKRKKLDKRKSKKCVEVESDRINEVHATDMAIQQDRIVNINDRIEIVGDIPESEDLILERKQSKKISSCPLPLHIAWYNLVSSNPELKQNILLYEPLQLEVLFIMLKEQGYNYHIQDLLTFLDKKCITVRVKQTNRQRKRF